MTFPPVPRNLSDFLQLGTWLGQLQTWGKDQLARVTALDQAPVKPVDGDFTITDENIVEYVGPGGHTITLPSAAAIPGRRSRNRTVVNNGQDTITLAAQTAQTVDGVASIPVPAGNRVDLVSNGATKWTSSPGLLAWLTGVAVPIIRIGHAIAVTAGGNVIAIGDHITSASGNAQVLIGDVRKGTGQDNVIIGYGNYNGAAIADGFSDNTVVGKDALINDGGANAAGNCLVTNAGGIADSVVGASGLGLAVRLLHSGAVLLGSGAISDAADKLRVFLGGAVKFEVVASPASGETGMYLVCHNGTSLAVRQVTLAASAGGQRVLQVAG